MSPTAMRPMPVNALRATAVLAALALAAYMLRGLLDALAWSVLIAVCTWRLREMLNRRGGAAGVGSGSRWSAALLTACAVLLLLLPTAALLIEAAREVPALLRVWTSSNADGLPAPTWLHEIPLVGAWLAGQWNASIAAPGALAALAHGFAGRIDLVAQRGLLLTFGHRLMSVFFCVVVLFFLYLKGDRLAADAQRFVTRFFGEPGQRTLQQAVLTMRGTVNGLVVVALGMAVLMSIAYAVAGVPHAVLWGLVTGLFGVVPLGATVALTGVALYLAAIGAGTAALSLFATGAVAIFIVDHFVRPYFISGASRLSSVLVLLGIVGGLETFGMLGLFAGPTLMAVVAVLWTELAGPRP